jgi:hypothetical protein
VHGYRFSTEIRYKLHRPNDRSGMKLRRASQEPELSLEDAELILHVGLELRDALAVHRRALDGGVSQDELLARSRQIAALDRRLFREMETTEGDLARRIAETISPFPAMWPLRRLGYSLTALDQEPPDTRAGLTAEDLDDLVDDELAEWLQMCESGARTKGWE